MNWLLNKWDWFIYKRFFYSSKRLCERNIGYAVAIKLHVDDYIETHKTPDNEHLIKAAYDLYEEVKHYQQQM